MKLDKFLSVFTETGREVSYSQRYEEVGSSALSNLPELCELFDNYSGAVFDKGLFKIHNKGSFYLWTKLTFEYFKKFKGNSYCFAFDWVGRQYAVNYNNGRKLILMLDPATAKVFELELDMESFLNEDLDEFKEGVLEFENFNACSEFLNSKIKFEECLGFKQFLF